jgi:peptidoglycan/LPS O-acetylase OafA/YrhL
VAFYHFMDDAAGNGARPPHGLSVIRGFLPWDAGVDIFFVISGFVIVHASARLFATGWAGVRLFIARRLARIVPLYWIMTAAFLAVLLAGRSAIHGDIGGPAYILASFFFIPWPRPDGLMQPAFGLGWTLNYEIFFYAIFTPCLLLARRYAIAACTAMICGFVLLGLRLHPASPQLAFWCNPLVLEFCAGMLLAQLLAAGLRLPTALRLALPLLAVALLHVFANSPGQWRVLSQGLPALLLVAAAALARPPATLSPVARLLVRLGDASYAMYLVHPFVMRGFSILWRKFHGHSAVGVTIYVIAGLAVSQLAALLIHARLERKITARLRGKSGVVDETIQMSGMRSDRLL